MATHESGSLLVFARCLSATFSALFRAPTCSRLGRHRLASGFDPAIVKPNHAGRTQPVRFLA
jgi:hypothetical protein